MSKSGKISPRDVEAISAYLDGALSEQEKASLEARLEESSGLREELEACRRLRMAVRSLPARKAPRQFTLTTLEARQARRFSFALPMFKYASLLSIFLLVVVFAGEWVFRNFSAPAAGLAPQSTDMRSMPAEEEIVSNSALPTETAYIERSNIALLNWGPSMVSGMGGAGGRGEEPMQQTAFQIAPDGSLQPHDSRVYQAEYSSITSPKFTHPNVGGGGILEPESAVVPDIACESKSAAEAPEEMPMTIHAATDSAEPIIFGINEAEQGTIIETFPPEPLSDSSDQSELPEAAPQSRGRNSNVLIKGGLGAAALLFAIAAFILSKKY